MDIDTKEGVVVFLRSNEGSKSECILPYLYMGRTEPMLPLYLENDNPFENRGMTKYDGHRVRIDGKTSNNNVFIVNKINAV